MVVKHVQRTPTTPLAYSADMTEVRNLSVTEFCSPNSSSVSCEKAEARHSLAGQFPTVSLFKEYQNAAMAVSCLLILCWISDIPLVQILLNVALGRYIQLSAFMKHLVMIHYVVPISGH